MKIKTYVVDQLSDAYPSIYQELGKDAIILKTKPIRQPGFFSFLRRKKLEVVAASDLANAPAKEPARAVQAEGHSVKLDHQQEMLKELSEVKGLIQSIVKGESSQQAIPERLEKWVLKFREQEIDEEVIQFIIKKFKLFENVDLASEEEVQLLLLTILEQLFDEGIVKEPSSTPFLITLVGPTGVGKTTTIAKLAAARVLHGRQKVGLLTADTFRIGAVEQLKTYANILNVPIEVVSNHDELQTSIQALKGCQTIFMDSAGRNYLEEEYIEDINHYLNYDAPQENILVLSMTTRWRDMRNIVEKMKTVPIDKLILTKWDETSCYGAALNLLYHYPYPLSYLSIGQGVPQDIMEADAKYLAKKVMGVE